MSTFIETGFGDCIIPEPTERVDHSAEIAEQLMSGKTYKGYSFDDVIQEIFRHCDLQDLLDVEFAKIANDKEQNIKPIFIMAAKRLAARIAHNGF